MIIDKINSDYNEDFDFYSFMSRVSLVGGTFYAAGQTINETKMSPDYIKSFRKDPFKKRVADKLFGFYQNSIPELTETERLLRPSNQFRESFGSTLKGLSDMKRTPRVASKTLAIHNQSAVTDFTDRIRSFTGTGKTSFDRGLADQIQSVVDVFGSKKGFGIDYREVDGAIGEVQFNFGKGGSMRINPRSMYGKRYSGTKLNNLEMVGGIVDKFVDGEPLIESSASFQLRKVLEDPLGAMSGFTNLQDLRTQADKVAVYNSDNFAMIARGFDPMDPFVSELERMQRLKVGMGPGISNKSNALKQISNKLGYDVGGEKGLASSFMYMSDETGANPASRFVGQGESINAPSLYRDVEVAKYSGPSLEGRMNWMTDILEDGSKVAHSGSNLLKTKVLTIDPKHQQAFLDAAQEFGLTSAGLAPEELFHNKNVTGELEDFFRTERVRMASADDLSISMKAVLEEVATANNISLPELLAQASESGGLGGGRLESRVSLGSVVKKLETQKQQQIEATQLLINEQLKERKILRSQGKGAQAKLQALQANIDLQKASKQELVGEFKKLKNLGIAPDGSSVVKYANKLEGTFISNISFSDGVLSMNLGRSFELGAMTKYHSGEGAMKRVIRENLNIQDILARMALGPTASAAELAEYGKRYAGITDVSFADSVVASKEKLSRNAHGIITSITENALETGDTPVLKILEQYGVTEEGMYRQVVDKSNYRDILADIGEKIYGETDREAAILRGTDKAKLADQFGYISQHIVGIEKHALDMGSRGYASISSRQMLNMFSMDMTEMVDEIGRSRLDRGRPLHQAAALQDVKQLMEKGSKSVALKWSDIVGNEIRGLKSGLFPSVSSAEDAKMFRKAEMDKLKQLKQLAGENLVIDMGADLGNRRIVLPGSDLLDEFTGIQIGSKSDIKSYTELDTVISKLLNPDLTTDDKKRLVQRYDDVIAQIENTLSGKMLKGKVSGSLYGKITSHDMAMDEYLKGKQWGHNVVFMHEADIVDRFGKNMISKSRTGDLYGVFTREPVESIFSSMPTRIISAEQAAKETGRAVDAQLGRIYVSKDTAMLRAMFGDFDGDAAGLVAYRGRGSQMKDFVNMNTNTSHGRLGKMMHAMQSELADAASGLKGRSDINDLIMSPEQRRSLNEIIAKSSKGSIGLYSNEMSYIHTAARIELEKAGGAGLASNADLSKFIKTEATTHLLIENILKAKHMATSDLQANRAQLVMDSLLGNTVGSKEARLDIVQSFFDDLMLGANSSLVRYELDAGSSMGQVTNMLADALVSDGSNIADKQEALAIAGQQLKAHASFAGEGKLSGILDLAEEGKKMGSPKELLNQLSAMLHENLNPDLELKRVRSDMISGAVGDAKRMGSKALKNLGIYAIAPAAAIGLVGSITSSPGNMEGPSYSDNKQKQSFKSGSGHINLPVAPPKYQRPNIQGMMRGGSDQFLDVMNAQGGANMRLTDHRGTMNKYKIEEEINRGY